MNNESNKQVENLLNQVSSHLGKTPDELKKAAINGNMDTVLNNLDKNESLKIQQILSDKNLSSKLLSTPQAQKLMKDLLYTIAAGLVEDKSAIKITEDAPDEEGVIVFHLSVAPDDMGRVIGKQGRIAKALRTIMRAGAAKKDLKVSVSIDW